jgi:hypothetical protein
VTEAINGQASLVSQPGLNEIVQSAQRAQAVVDVQKEQQAERKHDEYVSTVVKNQEAEAKQLRDDDPRQQRPRRQLKDNERQDAEPAPPNIDITI